MTGTDQPEDLELTKAAQEGVDILERAAHSGDPDHYQEVQALLLRDTVKEGDDDGPEVDEVDQAPGPLPDGLDLEEDADGHR